MAIFRQIYMSFWTDAKMESFTPEEKYFYLYLMTNPHTNIIGSYEISVRQMCNETGYNEDTIKKLIERLINYKIIDYDFDNYEILVCNWGKHNWNESEKLIKAIENQGQNLKTIRFKNYILECARDRVWIPYAYPMHTSNSIANTIPITIPNSISISSNDNNIDLLKVIDSEIETKKVTNKNYGKFENVILTEKEYEELKQTMPGNYEKYIEKLSAYMKSSGKNYKSHYATILSWYEKDKEKNPTQDTSYDSDQVKQKAQKEIEYKRKPKPNTEIPFVTPPRPVFTNYKDAQAYVDASREWVNKYGTEDERNALKS